MKHNWEYKRLGDICTVNFGKRIVAKDTTPGPYKVYGGGGATFTTLNFNRENCTIVSRFAMSSNCVRFVKGKFFLNDSGLTIETKIDYLTQGFIDKFLWVNQPLIFGLGRGMAQKNLNVKALLEINVPVPPMEVQKQIVAELDKINETIEDCRELLRNLDALAQSLFFNYFGDPVSNPKKWPVKRLKALTSLITNGTTPKGGQAVYVDRGITFLRSQNVWRDRLVMDDVAYIDEETNATMKGSMLHHNDILITKTGRINTENSSLGRSALFTGEDNTANINGHVYLVRLNGTLNPRFVLTILLTESYRGLIRRVCVGAIDKRQLNLSHIEQFPIILPPLELQEKFSARVEQINEQKKIVENTIAELQTLLDSRMDYWFN